MALQLKDMTKWLEFSGTEFALISGDLGHPLYEWLGKSSTFSLWNLQ
jgi:hypothetical protein